MKTNSISRSQRLALGGPITFRGREFVASPETLRFLQRSHRESGLVRALQVEADEIRATEKAESLAYVVLAVSSVTAIVLAFWM